MKWVGQIKKERAVYGICTVYFLPPTVFENHTNMSWNLCKKGMLGP